MAEENLTYKSALDELTKINNSIMSNDIDVDSLSEKVKRAMYLVDFCNKKLKTVQEEINSLLSSGSEGV
jgi:exodeoxyribonuclease VII small subunit